jgi:hypothetical protein
MRSSSMTTVPVPLQAGKNTVEIVTLPADFHISDHPFLQHPISITPLSIDTQSLSFLTDLPSSSATQQFLN